jgi:transposase
MAPALPTVEIDESAHTSSRRSARSDRIEIITRGARRRWSVEQKREIVAESFGRDLTPAQVARKHAISSGQLYTWRRELLSMPAGMMTRSAPRFVEVERAAVPLLGMDPDAAPSSAQPSPAPICDRPRGLIEVVLPGGVIVRLDAHVDASALRRVLDALEGR